MIDFVDVVAVKPMGDYRIWVRFSNGREGVRDFSDVIAQGGEMVVALRDKALFRRVVVQRHVPTWPNGYAIDATNLHMEMEREHLLSSSAAVE
jgi:hypothetical protein